MKIFNFTCRTFNDRTLEYTGTYPPKCVMVLDDENERIYDQKYVRYHILLPGFLVLLCMVITILALTFGIQNQRFKINELEEQVRTYKTEVGGYEELTSLNMEYLNVEALAGKYATYKGVSTTNRDSIFKFICESGAWYPEITMAQVIIESGGFQSNVGKNGRNGFGMKKCGEGPRSRPNLQMPGVNFNGYGIYMNWYHSVLDKYLWDLWLFSGKRPKSRAEYLNKMCGVYSETKGYDQILLGIAKDWESKVSNYKK